MTMKSSSRTSTVHVVNFNSGLLLSQEQGIRYHPGVNVSFSPEYGFVGLASEFPLAPCTSEAQSTLLCF